MLLAYLPALVSLQPYDPAAPAVAGRLMATILAVAPELTPEHIGSTSVPGLAGKGVIDLQVAAPSARIPELTGLLVARGWQRQEGPHAFPPTRPMLRAAIEHEGAIYRSHLHIVPAGEAELVENLRFRDGLRADPSLRAAYVAAKRQILDAGTREGVAYAEAKGVFVVDTLRKLSA